MIEELRPYIELMFWYIIYFLMIKSIEEVLKED